MGGHHPVGKCEIFWHILICFADSPPFCEMWSHSPGSVRIEQSLGGKRCFFCCCHWRQSKDMTAHAWGSCPGYGLFLNITFSRICCRLYPDFVRQCKTIGHVSTPEFHGLERYQELSGTIIDNLKRFRRELGCYATWQCFWILFVGYRKMLCAFPRIFVDLEKRWKKVGCMK